MTEVERFADMERRVRDIEQHLISLRSQQDEVYAIVKDVHDWLVELMPAARQASKVLEKRQALIKMVMPGARRGN